MARKIGFGIVGCGSAAKYHAAAISSIPDAELVCACGNTRERAEAFCKAQGIRCMERFSDLLASSDVDAVAICTPSGLHVEAALAAIQAGKHLIIEKPIGVRMEEADRIQAAAMASQQVISVVSQFRFSDAAQAVRGAAVRSAFGRLISASLTMRYHRGQEYYESGAWRGTKALDGGGILMNQGIHGIDLLAYIMGPVAEVTGYARTQLRTIEVEDTACAALTFVNGAVGTVNATVCDRVGSPMRMEICGEKGSVVLEDETISFWGLEEPCPCPIGAASQSSSSASPTGISAQNHTRQFQNFVAAIQGQEPLLVGVRDGRHALQIVCGIYQSAETGRPVVLDS